MSGQEICPFYGGRNMQRCDIGSDYISPYQVEITVRYCISRHQECPKCQALKCGPYNEDRKVSASLFSKVNPC